MKITTIEGNGYDRARNYIHVHGWLFDYKLLPTTRRRIRNAQRAQIRAAQSAKPCAPVAHKFTP